jgi:cellobiose transport system substrate-binding protein
MRLWKRRRVIAAIAGTAVAILLVTSACTSGSTTVAHKKVTLTVDVFGSEGFGYDALYERYMEQHPYITIKERGKGSVLGDYNTQLTGWLTSGRGAGDVVSMEEGTLLQYKAQAQLFVDLFNYGAGALENNFLSWKWKQGLTPDGKQLIGLGTDIGSLAICYRKDLFEKAKLPTDRVQVAALWPNWQKFIDTGRTFNAGIKNSNTKFVDASTNFFGIVLMQIAGSNTGYMYFDNSNKLVIDSNPDVKAAWQLTVDMINSGLSANLVSFSDAWNAGFRQSQFATVACPAWMTGVIKAQAGDAGAGKWDVAKAPGAGGNWGGSFLAVPKQSKHPKEAVELAEFLTGAEGQIEAFNKLGNLPSNPRALQDPAILNFTNEYFSNAPTGQILAAGATVLKPVYLGPKTQQIRDQVDAALRSIEQKRRTPDQAWQDAVTNGTNAAK